MLAVQALTLERFLPLARMKELAASAHPSYVEAAPLVFGMIDFTYHGHPDPLQCPEGTTRKSLVLYYFSNGRPAEEISGEHTTLFRARYHGEFKPSTSQRLRSLAKDVLLPITARQLKKIS